MKPNGYFLILFLFFGFSVLKICPAHSSFKSNSFFPSHFCTQAFNLHTARERFLVSNEAPPSWRPIEIFPAGVWDFSVLPSYRCLILFLTNFPILYVFRCLILFLTKTSLFCLHSIERFPAKLFSVGEVNCHLSIYIRVLAVFKLYFIIKYNVFNKYIIYATTKAIHTYTNYLTLVKGR